MKRAFASCIVACALSLFGICLGRPVRAQSKQSAADENQREYRWVKGVRLGSNRKRYDLRFETQGKRDTKIFVSIYERTRQGAKFKKEVALGSEFHPVGFEVINHRKTGTPFLTYSAGPQFPHTYVWRVNPKTFQAKQVLRAINGDTEKLASIGMVTEHMPAHYVYMDLPERTMDDRYATRRGRWNPHTGTFLVGKWHKEGNWKGGRLHPNWRVGISWQAENEQR